MKNQESPNIGSVRGRERERERRKRWRIKIQEDLLIKGGREPSGREMENQEDLPT